MDAYKRVSSVSETALARARLPARPGNMPAGGRQSSRAERRRVTSTQRELLARRVLHRQPCARAASDRAFATCMRR